MTEDQIIEVMNRSTGGCVSFWNKGLGDVGCEQLAAHIRATRWDIRKLYLGDNNIGPDGCKHICDALKEKMTIVELSLRNNNIGVLGCKYIRDLLRACRSMRVLSLHNTRVGNSGIAHICNALKTGSRLIDLDISHTFLDESFVMHVCDVIRENKRITHMDISDNPLSHAYVMCVKQCTLWNKHEIISANAKFDVLQTLVISGHIMNVSKRIMIMINDNLI